MVGEIFLAVTAVTAAAALSWWLLGLLLRPTEEAGAVLAVVPGRGDGLRLEQTVRLWVWLLSLGLWSGEIVIADVDLTPEGRALAQRLALRWEQVSFRPVDSLGDCMEHTYQ